LRGLRVFGLPPRWGERGRDDQVSVPLRGLRVFGLEELPPLAWLPVGVSVPLRGLRVFGLMGLAARRRVEALVSVPLRGLRVFGLPRGGQASSATSWSFRPLAGITGLRTGGHADAMEWVTVKFPSPCGDYGSSDVAFTPTPTAVPIRFRPLAGITGLRTRDVDAHRQRPL